MDLTKVPALCGLHSNGEDGQLCIRMPHTHTHTHVIYDVCPAMVSTVETNQRKRLKENGKSVVILNEVGSVREGWDEKVAFE